MRNNLYLECIRETVWRQCIGVPSRRDDTVGQEDVGGGVGGGAADHERVEIEAELKLVSEF